MQIVPFSPQRRDECADFWWHLYENLPYVHTPDGYQNVQSPSHIDPAYFLRRLDDGLGRTSRRWAGAVSDDSIFLALAGGTLVGLMVCSVDREQSLGNILSAYTQRDGRGRRVAAELVAAALRFFARCGLGAAAAGSDVSKTLEAESPVHMALLDAGFAWRDNWGAVLEKDGEELIKGHPQYGVMLGGSLVDFSIGPAIERTIERLAQTGIALEKRTADQFDELYGTVHEQLRGRQIEGDLTFVALHEGRVIGLLGELLTWSDAKEHGAPRIMGGCVPHVVPAYRGRGIGRALYHLGIAAAVEQGAVGGWTGTYLGNPARMIYQSVGYDYWYLAVNLIYRDLAGY